MRRKLNSSSVVDPSESGYLVGSEAIARFLGISSRRARYWLDEGVIPATKARGTWIGHRDTIDARFKPAEKSKAEA